MTLLDCCETFVSRRLGNSVVIGGDWLCNGGWYGFGKGANLLEGSLGVAGEGEGDPAVDCFDSVSG